MEHGGEGLGTFTVFKEPWEGQGSQNVPSRAPLRDVVPASAYGEAKARRDEGGSK